MYLYIHIFGVIYIHVWCNIAFIFCIITFILCITHVYILHRVYIYELYEYEKVLSQMPSYIRIHTHIKKSLESRCTHHAVLWQRPLYLRIHAVLWQMPLYLRIHTHVQNILSQDVFITQYHAKCPHIYVSIHTSKTV